MYLAMMLIATLSAPLTDSPKINCRTKLIGWKNKSYMTDYDAWTLEDARKQCPLRYPQSPCVSTFELKGFQNYKVTCGAPKPK